MQVELLLGAGWLFGSLYALASFFRPLPPFKGRKQAGLALGGVQIAAVAAAIALPTPMPATVAEAKAPAPHVPAMEAKVDAPSGDPSYLVRIKPGERASELPVASASDIASLKAKARAGLKALDAAEALLVEAVRTQRVELAREAGNGASTVAVAMTTDSKPLIGTAEYEKAEPCSSAAYTLARLAGSVAGGGQDMGEVQDRLSLQERYEAQGKKCEAWISR